MSVKTGRHLITLKRHKKIMYINCSLLRAIFVESCKNTRKEKPE